MPSAYQLQDGIVQLSIDNPYNGRRIVIDWIKPGDIYGEEFAFGLPANFTATYTNKHTWATDVALNKNSAADIFSRRMAKMIDLVTLRGVPHAFKLQFLYNLLNPPYPGIGKAEMLESCMGANTIMAHKIAIGYRNAGLYLQQGRKFSPGPHHLILAELEKTMGDIQRFYHRTTGTAMKHRHTAPQLVAHAST